MKNIFKKVIVFVLLLPLMATAGCKTGGRPLQNEDGEIWQLLPGEISDGIYVKNGEYYNPPLKYGLTFTSPKDSYQENRVVWIFDYRHLIPELSADKLLIEYSPDEYPTLPIIMEHFTSKGYSFGALFNKDGLELRFPGSSRICPRTSIARAIAAQVKEESNTRVTELNAENEPFPLNNVHDSGYIMGLQKDGYYRIGFYEGTIAKQFVVKADTEIFLQDASFTITEREQTKNGYFIIKLPEDMPNGLYCINGQSLIMYTAGTRDTLATPTPEPEGTPEPETTPVVDTIDTNGEPPKPAEPKKTRMPIVFQEVG